ITDSIRRWMESMPLCRLHNHYGPTETHVVTSYTFDARVTQWPSLPPIGRPLPHVKIRLLDKYGAPVALGEPGELHIGGPCLSRGYLSRPDLTAERFAYDANDDRWYRTGDIAKHTEGQYLYLGRTDRQMKVAGYRVEAGEVEAVLCNHPDIAQAVVT